MLDESTQMLVGSMRSRIAVILRTLADRLDPDMSTAAILKDEYAMRKFMADIVSGQIGLTPQP